MNRHSLLWLAVLLLLTCLTLPGIAEYIRPGVFNGYVATDRWGQHVFFNGTSHFFLSDTVARTLTPFHGLPLAITVTKISHSFDREAVMFTEVSKPTVIKLAQGLQLSASVPAKQVARGKGITVRYQLKNTTAKPYTLAPEFLSVILATRTPFSNKAIGYQDPDDRSYWHFYEIFNIFGESDRTRLVIACREFRKIVTAGEMMARGQDISPEPNNCVKLAPGGKFSSEAVIGKEVLPGEYEVFVYLPQVTIYPEPGPTSQRISVDVIEKR